MLTSYVTALRALKRNWSYSIINVAGLTLGLACCVLLFVAVRYELSFDQHNANADRIYRMLGVDKTATDSKPNTGITFPALAALRNDFPELKHQITMVSRVRSVVVSVAGQKGADKKRFQEPDGVITFAEPEYFNLFDYQWEKGSPQTALVNPNTVVLSDRIAHKYFGDTDPMGKTIRLDNRMDFVVTGIVHAPPVTSSLPFDVFLTHASVVAFGNTSPVDDWSSSYGGAQIYLMLPPSSTPAISVAQMEQRLVGFVKKYHNSETARTLRYVLQPLTGIHFATNTPNYSQRSISIEMIWAMVLVGLFILVTACINFINLATAQAIRRSKEVGVRKVLGSTRGQLVRQFLGETGVLTGISVVLAMVVAQLSLPYVSDLLNILPGAVTLLNPLVLGFLVLLGLLTTVLAGFYPALVLSGYQPILALKGKTQVHQTGRYLTLRRGLIIGQFAISQLLIIGTIIAYNQMNYFRSVDLGFSRDAILTVKLPQNEPGQLENLRAKISALPNVKSISFGMTTPSSSNLNWATGFRFGNEDKDPGYGVVMRPGDTAYIHTYGLKLLAGRMYQPADSIRELVINETFMKRLGFQKPEQVIGKQMAIAGGSVKKPIVGVVKDFNLFSLRERVEPSVLTTMRGNYLTMAIKLSAQHRGTEAIHQLLKQVETAWQATYPEFVFSYEFLDETLANFYKTEQQTYSLFQLLAGIALFIGCLGLYGVVAFMAETRTKEVGIRKVLGASITHIFGLFSIDFVKLVLVAMLISSPVAWYVMTQWLQKFVYKIDIEWWMFALAGLLAVGIALLTVSFQSMKAALMNPVKSLKTE